MANSHRRSLLLLAMLPALVPLAMVFKYGVDFPYWDEWDPNLDGLLIKMHQHLLTLGDLLQLHNEHRMLIPRLIILPLDAMTHFNTIAKLIVEWVIICITSIGVLQLLRQTHRNEERDELPLRVIGLWFLCNLMIFTPMQVENLLWGVGIINALPMAFTVWSMAIVMSNRPSSVRTPLAILLAACATYSSGNGILVWPMVIGVIALAPSRPGLSKKQSLAIWTIAAALFIGLYFVHYQHPEHAGANPYASDVWPALVYLATWLGAPFAFSGPFSPFTMGPVTGAILVLLFLTMLEGGRRVWRSNPDDPTVSNIVVWLAIGAFAIVSGALGSFTRAGLGVGQAIQSTRYVTFSLYLPLSLLVLVPMVCTYAMPRANVVSKHAPTVVASVIALLQLFCFPEAMRLAETECRLHHESKATMLLINVLPDNPTIRRLGYPDAEVAIREANELNAMNDLRPKLIATNNAAQIAETDPQEVAGVKGTIEHGGRRDDGMLAFIGWAALVDKSRPADLVFLTCDNAQHEPIIFGAASQMGIVRADVAEALGDSDFEFSGWMATIPETRIPGQIKQMTVRAWALDTDTGKAFLLPGEVKIQR